MLFHSPYGNFSNLAVDRQHINEYSSSSSYGKPVFSTSIFNDRSSMSSYSPGLPYFSNFRQRLGSNRSEFSPLDSMNSIDEEIHSNAKWDQSASLESRLSQDITKQTQSTPEKSKSRWLSRFTPSKKEPLPSTGDTSSLSSTTLESQKLEEIPLKQLANAPKIAAKGKGNKIINVHLSQNSTYALFWTQAAIHMWDIGTSPPTIKRTISTDSVCLLAAVTKRYLTYVVGNRDQRLTVRRP